MLALCGFTEGDRDCVVNLSTLMHLGSGSFGGGGIWIGGGRSSWLILTAPVRSGHLLNCNTKSVCDPDGGRGI